MDESQILEQLPKFDTTFFERYAKISLENLLGDKFINLANRDRPDLQDARIGLGIEVTRALEEKREDAIALINDMSGNDDISEHNFECINKYGYGYGLHRRFIGRNEIEYWSLAFPLRRIIESKVRKVADGFYGNFKEFGLYIFSKDELSFDDAIKTMDYTIEIQNKKPIKYSNMYIFDTKSLYVCDLVNDLLTQINVSQNQCESYYCMALECDDK